MYQLYHMYFSFLSSSVNWLIQHLTRLFFIINLVNFVEHLLRFSYQCFEIYNRSQTMGKYGVNTTSKIYMRCLYI
ncbi:hypothetical protein HanIR_Chr02g0060551 [Helianthus annuus]|nr:hypothetical protein HanIR_Chr02g0060551 [Helianthus annuus]